MYGPVYGCSCDSQRNKDGLLHFFEFTQASKGPDEKKRRDVWINFGKRKSFNPTKDVDDAVPTENKPLPATHEGQNPKRCAGTLSRRRVGTHV